MSGVIIAIIVVLSLALGAALIAQMLHQAAHDRPRPKEFYEDEEVLHRCRRHWVVLIQRSFLFALAGLLVTALVIYRAVGGIFIASGVGDEGRLDFTNILFLGLIIALALLWQRDTRHRAKSKKPERFAFLRDLAYLLVIGVLGLTVFFRRSGGRLFYIDPIYARGGDPINVLLILTAIAILIIFIYLVIDWANDYLILTSTRVIYDDQQLLVRHIQQELAIDNVQQVNVRADSYFAHTLGQLDYWIGSLAYALGLVREKPKLPVQAAFATIVIGSVSPQNITFDRASHPHAMQSAIQAKLNERNRAQEPALLRRLIEDQIYGNKPPKDAGPPVHVTPGHHGAGIMGWLFHPNPEKEGDTITWRPFWLFMVLHMLRPLGILLVGTVGVVILSRLGMLSAGWAFVLWLPFLLVAIGWIVWIREEHEHDKYILNLQNVIDVDKRPFGPESSRRAPLGSIQNINFEVSFFESILGYGNVRIKTAGGGGDFTFHHVPDPRGVQATINDYLTYFKKREKERQLQDSLALLRQYHVLQVEHGEVISDQKLSELVAAKLSEHRATEGQAQAKSDGGSELHREIRTAVRNEMRRRAWQRRRSSRPQGEGQ